MNNFLKQLRQISLFNDVELAYLKKNRPYNQRTWSIQSNQMKAIKRKMKISLFENQDGKCVYCGLKLDDEHNYLSAKYIHREHIACKSKYPRFMFEELNLVLSCERCNTKKMTDDTILFHSAKYIKCKFKIIHPYFDNPNHHVRFKGPVILPKTNKGKSSIKMFQLSEKYLTERRAEVLSLKRLIDNIVLSPIDLDYLVNFRKY